MKTLAGKENVSNIKTNMNKPLITIITVCYNAASTIEQTIISVLNQTYPNIEYIIIDGKSTDGTIEIIKKYDNKISYWISEPDRGIYDAMNKGVKSATGEWTNFMNSGDTFYSNTIINDIFYNSVLPYDVIYGNTNYVYYNGSIIKKAGRVTSKNYMPFTHQSSFVKTSLLKSLGFDYQYKICADRSLFYKIFSNKKKFQNINLTISNYEAEKGISSINANVLLFEIGKIENKTSSISWKIYYYLRSIYNNISLNIRKILPVSVVFKIRTIKNYFNIL